MAIYYFHMDVKSKAQGHSVESVGAYMTGTKMTDALTNEKYDHRTKDDVYDVFVMAPAWGASHFKNLEALCRKISLREKRKDSQLCRYAMIALPIELQGKENRKLIREFCQQAFVRRGMVVLVAIHGIGSANPHAHIIITMRRFDAVSGEFSLKQREWNSPALLKSQRKEWEVLCNQFLEQAGFAERISCETNEKQGIIKPKQKHMGSHIHKLWKEEGIIGERSAQYVLDCESKELQIINKEITEIESEIITLKSDQAASVAASLNELPVCSLPTFDLSRVYGRGFEPELVRHKPRFECNFDEELKLVPTVPITRIGNPPVLYQHQMMLKDRIQQYINNHWDLRDILPDSVIVELGLQNVVQEILEIRGENRLDMGFSFWDQPDDEFAETCESNLVIDEEGQRWLKRAYNDPFRDYVPDEDMHPHPTPPSAGPGMGV